MSGAGILDWLATPHPELTGALPRFDDWWARYRQVQADRTSPIERALAGGYCADRLAWAFTAGYQGALRRMVPELPDDRLVSLCVTEAGGGHPRALRARLEGAPGAHTVTGEKRWISDARPGGILLVACVEGDGDDGRPRIRLARIDGDDPGVSLAPIDLPMIPEAAHATVRLEAAAVERVLPGDGYAGYIRPFRTAEDAHVSAAVIGLLLRIGADAGWDRGLRARLLGMAATARALAAEDPNRPGVQLAVGGAMDSLRALIAGLDWSNVAPEVSERWARDVALLNIAGRARAKRAERAWDRLAVGG